MPNSSSQIIPDMLDRRQIWESGRTRKGSNSAETVLRHPCRSSFLEHGTTPNGGVKGSTHNRCSDPKCPSARCLRIVREDTGAPSEGATCARMVAGEAVG
ncbi:hypothetical protein TNCV_2685751 [Trichonephila clavipes]|nr:hypothetical protein TNCV_2685751 [Trichonephila clavipes]